MNIILYNIVFALVSILVGYFIGSIPFGIIIGKVFFGRDPRLEGSGNSGGTNVGRIFGKAAGLICIIFDMLKGIGAMLIIWAILKFTNIANIVDGHIFDEGQALICLAGLGAIIGHCYPIYAQFKGGKGVATYCGLGLGASWAMAVGGIIVFFTTLKAKKYVSLASIIVSVFSATFSWLLFVLNFFVKNQYINFMLVGNGLFIVASWEYATLMTIGTILVIVRHIPNIKRLVSGNESKIKWMH